MTLSELEVLIHCYISTGPHPRHTAQPIREALQRCLSSGTIYVRRHDGDDTYASVFQTTEKGRIWLNMILATPEPVKVWVDPRERRDIE